MALNANISVENFVARAKLLASLRLFPPYNSRIVNVPQEHRGHFSQSVGMMSKPCLLPSAPHRWVPALAAQMHVPCLLLTSHLHRLLAPAESAPTLPSLPTFQRVSSQCHRAIYPLQFFVHWYPPGSLCLRPHTALCGSEMMLCHLLSLFLCLSADHLLAACRVNDQ